MLELKVEIRDVEAALWDESLKLVCKSFSPKPGKGYKNIAKLITKLREHNPPFIWINTNVYAKKDNRWIYFMTFDDKYEVVCGDCWKRDFATRKRVQRFLRRLRKCQERLLRTEEVPERRGITEDIHITFSH